MAFDFSSIKPTRHAKPPRLLIHGAEGAGKSTFLSECPDSVFIQTEDGLAGIDAQAFPLAETLTDVMEQLALLINEQHDFKAVWIDSADWLEKLIHAQVCADYKVASIEKAAGGYGKGYIEAVNIWREVLRGLDRLNNEKSMFVGFTCHSRVVEVKDPEFEEAYDCYKLKLHSPKSGNGSLEMLLEWADIVGFAKIKYHVAGHEVAKSDVKKMRNVSQSRMLCVNPSAAYVAKNRYNITSDIEMVKGQSWAKFIEVLTNAN